MNIKAKFETDFLVIGSGASGGIIFDELKKEKLNFFLIEEGDWVSSNNFEKSFIGSLSTIWKDGGYQISTGNPKIPFLQGQCVGGSTIINGAIMQKTTIDYAKKLKFFFNNAAFFDFKNILKVQQYFVEQFGIKNNTSHIISESIVNKICLKLGMKASSQLRSAKNCKFTDTCLNGCPIDGKVTIENKIFSRINDKNIIYKTKVEKIIIQNKKGSYVKCVSGNNKFYIFVNKKIILCAGAINTPLILLNSKIKNKNIGKNLTCHLSTSLSGKFNKTKNQIEVLPMGYEITTNLKNCEKFFSQSLPKELLLSKLNLIGNNLLKESRELENISSWVGSISSKSRGMIKKNIFGRPKIIFSPHHEDLKKIIFVNKVISNFLFELGAKKVFLPYNSMKNEIESISEYPKFLSDKIIPKKFNLASSHIFGSCSRTNNDSISAIEANFKLKGTDNIFIADASVLYNSTEYNPQLTIMTVAKIASEVILNSD